MAAEVERTRKREAGLVEVFAALDARDDAEMRAASALASLRDLGETVASLAELTGLTSREIGSLVKLTESGEDAHAADAGDGEVRPDGEHDVSDAEPARD